MRSLFVAATLCVSLAGCGKSNVLTRSAAPIRRGPTTAISVILANGQAITTLSPKGAAASIPLTGHPAALLADATVSPVAVQRSDGSTIYTSGTTQTDTVGRIGVSLQLRSAVAGGDDRVLLPDSFTLALGPDDLVATVQVSDPLSLSPGSFDGTATGRIVSIDRDGTRTEWSEPGRWYVQGFTQGGQLIAGLGVDDWEGPKSIWAFSAPGKGREVTESGRLLTISGDALIVDEGARTDGDPPQLATLDVAGVRPTRTTTLGADFAETNITRGVATADGFAVGWETPENSGVLFTTSQGKQRKITFHELTYAPTDLTFDATTNTVRGLAYEPTTNRGVAAGEVPRASPSASSVPGKVLLVECPRISDTCSLTPTAWVNDGIVRIVMNGGTPR